MRRQLVWRHVWQHVASVKALLRVQHARREVAHRAGLLAIAEPLVHSRWHVLDPTLLRLDMPLQYQVLAKPLHSEIVKSISKTNEPC